ncbi:Uncharacterised protein r2_g1057 [Pycnogonum litorale]
MLTTLRMKLFSLVVMDTVSSTFTFCLQVIRSFHSICAGKRMSQFKSECLTKVMDKWKIPLHGPIEVFSHGRPAKSESFHGPIEGSEHSDVPLKVLHSRSL